MLPHPSSGPTQSRKVSAQGPVLSPASRSSPRGEAAVGEQAPEPGPPEPPKSLVEETNVSTPRKRPARTASGRCCACGDRDRAARPPPARPRRRPRPRPRRCLPLRQGLPRTIARLRATRGRRPARGGRTGACSSTALAGPAARRDHRRRGRRVREFVKKFPEHDYADNAQYWLGECFYDRKDYSMAVRSPPRGRQVLPGQQGAGRPPKGGLLVPGARERAAGAAGVRGADSHVPADQAAGLAAAKVAKLDHLGPRVTQAVAPMEVSQ